jgi:putative ABC transport system substrate-binding protein
MVRRPVLSVILALALLAAPFAAKAQQPGKTSHIGILSSGWPAQDSVHIEAFRQGLRDAGWVEGQNLVIEWRSAEGKTDRLAALAAELVRLKVVVIVAATSTRATQAAMRATTTIPIVMVAAGAPLDTGLVASLARPGGNVTGNTTLGAEVGAKRLEFVKELVPRATQIALLWNPDNPANVRIHAELVEKAPTVGLKLFSVRVRTAEEFDGALALLAKERPDALLLTADPMHQLHMGQVIEFAAKQRLPAIYNTKDSVMAGGLMSYGANQPELYRRAATYVAKILNGAKVGELPVEQPTKFELVINLKTAKALGLKIPPSVLARADEVIE